MGGSLGASALGEMNTWIAIVDKYWTHDVFAPVSETLIEPRAWETKFFMYISHIQKDLKRDEIVSMTLANFYSIADSGGESSSTAASSVPSWTNSSRRFWR